MNIIRSPIINPEIYINDKQINFIKETLKINIDNKNKEYSNIYFSIEPTEENINFIKLFKQSNINNKIEIKGFDIVLEKMRLESIEYGGMPKCDCEWCKKMSNLITLDFSKNET